MTGKIVDDPRVANPGDPDLDLHLSGLLIASYLMLPAGPDAAEFVIAYHTSLATGWWLTPAGRFVPERVTAASHTFIVSGSRGPARRGNAACCARRARRAPSCWSSGGGCPVPGGRAGNGIRCDRVFGAAGLRPAGAACHAARGVY
jgi:hypothetical protein